MIAIETPTIELITLRNSKAGEDGICIFVVVKVETAVRLGFGYRFRLPIRKNSLIAPLTRSPRWAKQWA